jgi:dihydroorotase
MNAHDSDRQSSKPTSLALVNARLIDPESRYDGPGSILIEDGKIARVLRGTGHPMGSSAIKVIDCEGHVLMPGLIDGRARTGEPGFEPRETLKSAAQAAAAGGVTSFVVLPDTRPALDDPAMVDFLIRRARHNQLVKIYAAGAATKGLEGSRMSEIGLMKEAGAVYFSDADNAITDSKVLARILAYAHSFGALVAHRPKENHLTKGAVATSGDMATRMGLSSEPAIAERIALERDLGLVELTKARFMADLISTEDSLHAIRRARLKGLQIHASVSIHHLCFNELDIGDYRTFFRLDPPLRSEKDRQALIEGLRHEEIDLIVSNHTPLPAEDKRLPFSESTPGAIGLQTLLQALLGLHMDYDLELAPLLACVTCNPAALLGLPQGRLAQGSPADLIMVDIDIPYTLREADIVSKSKNSPFENRALYGRVLKTMVDGHIIFES